MESTAGQYEMTKEKLKHGAHIALAHSYSLYFFAFLFGIILDFIFPLDLLSTDWSFYFGIIFIISGPMIIFWAQNTSRNLKKDGSITKETFQKGPYRFSRGPTQFGISLLLVGFGILANAFFVVVFTLISAIVTRFTFLRKQEMILEQKYGAPYLEYKKSVRL